MDWPRQTTLDDCNYNMLSMDFNRSSPPIFSDVLIFGFGPCQHKQNGAILGWNWRPVRTIKCATNTITRRDGTSGMESGWPSPWVAALMWQPAGGKWQRAGISSLGANSAKGWAGLVKYILNYDKLTFG